MNFIFTSIITLFIFQNISAQVSFPIDEKGNIVYEKVFEVPNKTKEQLYNAAMDWIVETYRSSNDVIQLKDKERHKIIGKGNFKVIHWMENEWYVNHTITIRAKDGRFKVTINQISFKAATMKGVCGNEFTMENIKNGCLGKNSFDKLRLKAQDKIRFFILDIQEYMNNTPSDENDNW